jgi:hypothetical protein
LTINLARNGELGSIAPISENDFGSSRMNVRYSYNIDVLFLILYLIQA